MNSGNLMPSRRLFLKSGLATVASAFVPSTATRLHAQEASLTGAQFRAAGKTAMIQTRGLRGGLLVLMGSGSNIIVLPGGDGKLTVDSGLATSEPQVRAALGAISPAPLSHLLNTRWHFDHTDGSQWMHRDGAVIVAHENTRKRMSQRQSIPAFSIDFQPAPAAALPTVVFSQTHKLELNAQTIVMDRYTPAHTDSDISVFFENANALHTGDTWFNGYYPFIDYDSGGSIDGMIAASSENLERIDAQTIVLPGHGDIGSRTELVSFHNMLVDVRARVAELKKEVFRSPPQSPQSQLKVMTQPYREDLFRPSCLRVLSIEACRNQTASISVDDLLRTPNARLLTRAQTRHRPTRRWCL